MAITVRFIVLRICVVPGNEQAPLQASNAAPGCFIRIANTPFAFPTLFIRRSQASISSPKRLLSLCDHHNRYRNCAGINSTYFRYKSDFTKQKDEAAKLPRLNKLLCALAQANHIGSQQMDLAFTQEVFPSRHLVGTTFGNRLGNGGQ